MTTRLFADLERKAWKLYSELERAETQTQIKSCEARLKLLNALASWRERAVGPEETAKLEARLAEVEEMLSARQGKLAQDQGARPGPETTWRQ